MLATWGFWNKIIFQRVAEKHLTWFGFAAMLWGLALKRHGAREGLFDLWLLALLIYAMIVTRGSYVHQHYQLPFVIPGAALAGKVFSRYFEWRFWRTSASAALAIVLAGTVVCSVYRHWTVLQFEVAAKEGVYRLSRLVRERTEPDALVVAVDNGDPTDLYHAGRKGWCASVNEAGAPDGAYLADKAARGARYVFGMHELFRGGSRDSALRRLFGRHGVVHDDGRVFILRLAREAN